MEKFLLAAETHLASNQQWSSEDTHFLKRLMEEGAFFSQRRSGTTDSFHAATLSFPSPSNFHVTGFKVLSITSAFRHLKDLVYAQCTTGMCQLNPAPVLCGALLEAWYSSLEKRFLKIYNSHLLPSQMHPGMCQKLWMCCSDTYCSVLITYPITEKYPSSLANFIISHTEISHRFSSYHLEIKRNNQLQISRLSTSTLKQRLLYCTIRNYRAWKQWRKLALWAVRNYHTRVKN